MLSLSWMQTAARQVPIMGMIVPAVMVYEPGWFSTMAVDASVVDSNFKWGGSITAWSIRVVMLFQELKHHA